MGKNLEPQFAFRCDKETIEKLEYIAKQNTRTRNQEMKHIIKNYVRQYEQEHGEIPTKTTAQIWEEQKELMKNSNVSPAKKLSESWKKGKNFGETTVDEIQENAKSTKAITE